MANKLYLGLTNVAPDTVFAAVAESKLEASVIMSKKADIRLQELGVEPGTVVPLYIQEVDYVDGYPIEIGESNHCPNCSGCSGDACGKSETIVPNDKSAESLSALLQRFLGSIERR